MSPTVTGTTGQAIPHTRGLPIPLAPVVHRTIERRNTSPFQQPARLDDAARFRAQRDAAAQLADLDRRKRAARPSAQKPARKKRGSTRTWDLDAYVARYQAGATTAELAAEAGIAPRTMGAALSTRTQMRGRHGRGTA